MEELKSEAGVIKTIALASTELLFGTHAVFRTSTPQACVANQYCIESRGNLPDRSSVFESTEIM